MVPSLLDMFKLAEVLKHISYMGDILDVHIEIHRRNIFPYL